MATHGNHTTKGTDASPRSGESPRPLRGSFPGTNSEQWHRALTGREAPEPVSAKLRSIYGNVVAEELPDHMLDLLARLDQKTSGKE